MVLEMVGERAGLLDLKILKVSCATRGVFAIVFLPLVRPLRSSRPVPLKKRVGERRWVCIGNRLTHA